MMDVLPFVTMAKKYNMDEYAIKRLVGHHIKDLTERVYTQRSIDWLKMRLKRSHNSLYHFCI